MKRPATRGHWRRRVRFNLSGELLRAIAKLAFYYLLSTRISDLVVVLCPAEQASRLDFPGLGREEPRHKG